MNITKPKSSSWDYTDYSSITRQLYIGTPKSKDETSEPQLYYEQGVKINYNSIDSIVLLWKSETSKFHFPGLRFQLNIDESISMENVNKLKAKIEKSSISRIGYSVVPSDINGRAQLRYRRNIIPANANFNVLDSFFPDHHIGKDIYEVSHNSTEFILDKVKLDSLSFKKEIDNIIETNSNYVFLLNYDNSLPYGKFIDLYSTIYGAIIDKRNIYSELHYGKSYDWNNRQTQQEIRNKYPLNIEDHSY